jgi:protein ERP2
LQVYVEVAVGNRDDPPMDEDGVQHQTALTQMETSLASMHDAMRHVTNIQTHLRIREATHRLTAEFMNQRVLVSSAELRQAVFSRCGAVGVFACRAAPGPAVFTLHGLSSLGQYVSAAEMLLLVGISVFQIVYLRSLFADRPNRYAPSTPLRPVHVRSPVWPTPAATEILASVNPFFSPRAKHSGGQRGLGGRGSRGAMGL